MKKAIFHEGLGVLPIDSLEEIGVTRLAFDELKKQRPRGFEVFAYFEVDTYELGAEALAQAESPIKKLLRLDLEPLQ